MQPARLRPHSSGAIHHRSFLALALAVGLATSAVSATAASAATSATSAEGPPVAPQKPVTDTYFGTEVVDNYRYFEDLKDPAVQQWMHAQADYTRSRLDALPEREALLHRLHELGNTTLRRFGFERRGDRYFYLVLEPGDQVAKLYTRDGLSGQEQLLVDPAALAAGTKTHYSIDFYAPSGDGQRIAYGVSAGGSENSTLHVIEVNGARALDESIDRTNGSRISWRADNRSFFYLRYDPITADTPAARQLYDGRTYLHVLGRNGDGHGDPTVFGRGVAPKLAVPDGQGTYVITENGSSYAVAVANHNMDDNPSTLYVAPLARVAGPATPWKKIADVNDGVSEFRLVGGELFFLSRKNAPHFRILATSLAKPDIAHARVVVPEGTGIVTGFAVAPEGLYVRTRDGAASHLKLVSLDGHDTHSVTLPFEGNASLPVTDPGSRGALVALQGWTRPAQLFAYDAAHDSMSDTGLVPQPKVDTSQLESREVLATSYDGTAIPLSIVYRKGTAQDGSHPTVLVGYGSYGNSLEPRFDPRLIAWLERGGVYAVAHVRGGGEYGDEWHRAGQKATKLNTVFDFVACGDYLVDQHYTRPELLAGEGGSAGGITVGGALTWAPQHFGVILDVVGMSDTLRSETEPNGPPNTSEFGTVKDMTEFHGLYAMGAYFHVRDHTAYPAVMFVTGANDPRVAPWHMMKMAARVQSATSSDRPVLLRIDFDAGHGIGSSVSQAESLLADLYAFTLWQTGDPAFQPGAAH